MADDRTLEDRSGPIYDPEPVDGLYDPECHALAEHVLGDDDVPPAENELRIKSLAARIQEAVEGWIEAEGHDYSAPSERKEGGQA